MRFYKFFIITLLIAGVTQAAELKRLEFRELTTDYTAQTPPIFDMDNNMCAALRVESTRPVSLTIAERTYKTKVTEKGEYYFFFSPRERVLTLQSPGYKDLTLAAPQTGFKSNIVYYVRINPVGEITYDVTINVTPLDANVMVNGQKWGGPTQKLAPGEYIVEISKDGFDPLKQKITVPMQPVSFNFALSKTVVIEKMIPPAPPKEILKEQVSGLPTLEAYDLSFKMLSCKGTPDNKLIIKFQITNLSDQDRNFYFEETTRIFDNKGIEYPVSIRQIGNKTSGKYTHLMHRLISGVPTELTLTFDNVPGSVQVISLLELAVSDWKLPFRSFPVSR